MVLDEPEPRERFAIPALVVLALAAAALAPLVRHDLAYRRQLGAGRALEGLQHAFLQYHADTGSWPCRWEPRVDADAQGELASYTCLFRDDGSAGWSGPYLHELAATAGAGASETGGLLDPWGMPFRVLQRGAEPGALPNGAVVIYSGGADREIDTPPAWLVAAIPSDDDLILPVRRVPDR